MCTRKCRNNGAFGVYSLAASFTSVFFRPSKMQLIHIK
nr:MAG TPA: hypothetical protein [Caudoviricetes sp.]